MSDRTAPADALRDARASVALDGDTQYDEAAEVVAMLREYADTIPGRDPDMARDAASLIERLAAREPVGYVIMRNGEYLANRPIDLTAETYCTGIRDAALWGSKSAAEMCARNAGGTVLRVWVEKGDGANG